MLRATREAIWADVQNAADMRLEGQFRETAGNVESASRAEGYGYHTGSQLMKAGSEGVPVASCESGGGGTKPAGLPVKSSHELRAYGQRVLRPGQVQPFGVVLLMSMGEQLGNAPFGTIQAASENAKSILGVDAKDMIDEDLFDVSRSPFDAATLQHLKKALTSNDPAAEAPIIATLTRSPSPSGIRAYLIVHMSEEGAVIDVEPLARSVQDLLQGSLQSHTLARSAVTHLQDLQSQANLSIKDFCQAMVEETAEITGYDRVMLYEFQPDMHGLVVAEKMSPRVPDSMLDLHFPATDIPQANRKIFMHMRSRMIANVGIPSVKVVQSPRLSENIILAGSQLRGVSGCHAQYLQNMGVHATLVLSIVLGKSTDDDDDADEGEQTDDESRLWGLLVCHHYSGPRRIDYDQRSAVEFLAKVFALQLKRLLENKSRKDVVKISVAQSAICNSLKTMEEKDSKDIKTVTESLVATLMEDTPDNVMLDVCSATGCAMLLEGKWFTVGQCPDDASLSSVMSFLKENGHLSIGGQFVSVSLKNAGYHDFEAMRRVMAGLVAVDLGICGDLRDSFGAVVWMRGELIQEETWAGDRRMPQARAVGAEMSPRASFQAMKELVEFQTKEWAPFEINGAKSIQELLQDTIRLHLEGQITTRISMTLNQQRLRNMDELSKVASELSSAINSASAPIMRLDSELKIASCNSPAKAFFDFNEDAHGKPIVNFLHEWSHATVQSTLSHAVLVKQDPPRMQVWIKRKDGTQVQALLFCHLKSDIFGDVKELVLVFRDISTQASLIGKLATSKHDMLEVIENSGSPIFAVNNYGHVTDWNYAMKRLTGLPKESVAGRLLVGDIFGATGTLKTVSSQSSHDPKTEISALIVLALGETQQDFPSGSQLADINFSFLKAPEYGSGDQGSQKQIEVNMHCAPRFSPDGKVEAVLCFLQDLTVSKALEKAIAVQTAAESASEAKTRHIAFLCHEIRNPVNGILATVQSMEDMMLNRHQQPMDLEEMMDLVKTTTSCTDQLRRTVDGILDIDKIEEQKLQVVCNPFKVRGLMRTVVSQVVKACEEKGLVLDCQVSPDLEKVILNGDEGRIQQVLANFCWNSVKFTQTGRVDIVVESEPTEREEFKRMFFKVVDTGKGMDQKMQESLFQRFAMGQHRVGKYGGSGLGLSICRSLAELMNGHVHCFSTPGKGSTFVLELELEVMPAGTWTESGSGPGKKITKTGGFLAAYKSSYTPLIPDTESAKSTPKSVPVPEPVENDSMKNLRFDSNIDDLPPQMPVPQPAQFHPQFTHQIFHHPMHMPMPPPYGLQGALQYSVIREEEYDSSVAVLVETSIGDSHVRQVWGASPKTGNYGEDLVRAQENAMHRMLGYMPAGSYDYLTSMARRM